MSGGSMNYLCFKMEEYTSYIDDKELKDLWIDLSTLMHDLEWSLDGDISREDYENSLLGFKNKWFINGENTRAERLRKYIHESLHDLEQELDKLI